MAHWLHGALVLVLLVAAVGCDSGGDEDTESDVDGVWQSRGDDVIYYSIDTDASRVTIYNYLGDSADDVDDCYIVSQAAIIDANGGAYTMRFDDGEEVDFTANGDVLRLSAEDDDGNEVSAQFDRSTRSEGDLDPECAFDDPVSGLWESTGDDVFYLDIDTDAGSLDIYDFAGDDFDQGDDCYVVVNADILSESNSVYQLRFNYDDGTTDMGQTRLEAQGNALFSTISNSDGTGTVITRYNTSDEDVSSLTPECAAGDDTGSALRGPRQKDGAYYLQAPSGTSGVSAEHFMQRGGLLR